MTLKRSRRTFTVIKSTLVLSCSLFLVCLAGAQPKTFSELREAIEQSKTDEGDVRLLREFVEDGHGDVAFRDAFQNYVVAEKAAYGWTLDELRRMIDARAFVERSTSQLNTGDAAKRAAEIKKNPLYRDDGVQESSNWASKAFQNLGEMVQRLIRPPNMDAPNVQPPNVGGFDFSIIMWALLAVLLGIFVFFAARHFNWQKKLRRKASAILEDDEPERSLDEWLEQADLLTKQGRYREAVRCLYLACLLRFDEYGIARFIRGETNWEHLARIERSGKLDGILSFREPTQEFDRIWYGFRVRGLEDVERFRSVYEEITSSLRAKAA
jgi:hypothetical protein